MKKTVFSFRMKSYKQCALKFAIICLPILYSMESKGQGMAVNTSGNTADASAMLDVQSTTKGFLAPKMTSAQRTSISSPATGLVVFQTDGTTGFYYNAGTPGSPSWVQLLPADGSGAGLTGVQNIANNSTAGNSIVSALGSATTGTIPAARLGTSSGTSTTFLNGGGAFSAPFTLTTTGSSGAATFSSGTLNIPQYSSGGSTTWTTYSIASGTLPATAGSNYIINANNVTVNLPASPAVGTMMSISLASTSISSCTIHLSDQATTSSAVYVATWPSGTNLVSGVDWYFQINFLYTGTTWVISL